MTYLLTSYLFQGEPSIGGNGAGVVSVPLKIEKIVSDGYVDISSIENWYYYGTEVDYDFEFIRDRVVEEVRKVAIAATISEENDPSSLTPELEDVYLIGSEPTGLFTPYPGQIAIWNGAEWEFEAIEYYGYSVASESEKDICRRLNICKFSDIVDAMDYHQAVDLRAEYHALCTESRVNRALIAEALTDEELPYNKDFLLLTITSRCFDLNIGDGLQEYSIDMHKLYKIFGVRGTLEDYHPIIKPMPAFGILDYFYNRSIFTGYGVLSKNWTPVTLTLSEYVDKVRDVLLYGEHI